MNIQEIVTGKIHLRCASTNTIHFGYKIKKYQKNFVSSMIYHVDCVQQKVNDLTQDTPWLIQDSLNDL